MHNPFSPNQSAIIKWIQLVDGGIVYELGCLHANKNRKCIIFKIDFQKPMTQSVKLVQIKCLVYLVLI